MGNMENNMENNLEIGISRRGSRDSPRLECTHFTHRRDLMGHICWMFVDRREASLSLTQTPQPAAPNATLQNLNGCNQGPAPRSHHN